MEDKPSSPRCRGALTPSGLSRITHTHSQTMDRCNSVMEGKDYVKKQLQRMTIRADVPSMDLYDNGAKGGTTFNSTARSNSDNALPLIAYQHGAGDSRNLPGHSQIIQILAEIARNNPGKQTISDLTLQQNDNWLELYSTNRPVQREKTRRTRPKNVPICSFCQEKGGKHKKWCVNLVDTPAVDPYSNMKRSKTDISEFFRRPKKVKPVIVEKPLKPSKQFALRPADFPDYTNLHREVYEHALAVSRAKLDKRLARKNRFVLERQLTDPFVFSYMNTYGRKSDMRVESGMVHIFGEKNSDFTKHYEYSVRKIKSRK